MASAELYPRNGKPKDFLRPREWPVSPADEALSPRDRINEVVIGILTKATPQLVDWVDRGIGRNVISEFVPGREEDSEIKIDSMAEDLVREKLEEAASGQGGLTLAVLSEHNNFNIGEGVPSFYVAVDPFDNSDEYRKGFPTPPFLVFSFYDQGGNPMAAGASNLSTGHMYINREGKNYEYNPRTRELKEFSIPPEIRSVQDSRFNLISYDGRYEYSAGFREYFAELSKDMARKSTFHGKAGAHTYIDLASGAASAYIMVGEPRGEIDPGRPFALSAGFVIASVHPVTGHWEHYKFDPSQQHETVPLYIAASSYQLLYQIIGYHMDSINRGQQPGVLFEAS